MITCTLTVALSLASACPKGGQSKDAALDPAKYSAYFTQYPFGGHTLEWWETRVAELAPGGAHADASLYALTVERAQKNGLAVDATGSRIVVKPTPAMTAVLMQRLEVK